MIWQRKSPASGRPLRRLSSEGTTLIAFTFFVHAPTAFKADRIVRLYGESEKKPEERLAEKDKKRSVNYRHYTDREWGVCQNYNLSLDSGAIGIEKCVSIIVDLVRESEKE